MTSPKLAFATDYGRFYKTETRKAVPSITNVLKQKNKPGINKHNIKTAAEYAVDNYDRLHALTPDEAKYLIKESVYAPNPATALGDLVHHWIDEYVRTGLHPREQEPGEWGNGTQMPAYPDAERTARRMWRQFEGFRDKYNQYGLQFLDSEFTVWSDTYGYAGTGDLSLLLGGMHVCVDTKTGKAAWPDMGMQLAAIMKADFIITQDGSELPMPEWDRGAILHIRPTFSRLIPVERIDECFEAFLGLLANFKHETYVEKEVLGMSPKIQTDYRGV